MIGDTTTASTTGTLPATGSTDWLSSLFTGLGTDAQALAQAYATKVSSSGTPQPTYNILPSATSVSNAMSGMSNYLPYVAIGLVAFMLMRKKR